MVSAGLADTILGCNSDACAAWASPTISVSVPSTQPADLPKVLILPSRQFLSLSPLPRGA